MKRAGEVLSAWFDEGLMKKAQGYSRLFACWRELAERHGIAAAADHSRITGLDRGVLWVEVDHPGWKQILQTKESRMLEDLRRRFPDMDIGGISIALGKGETRMAAEAGPEETAAVDESGGDDGENAGGAAADLPPDQINKSGYNAIQDDAFRESLQRLERSIAARSNH